MTVPVRSFAGIERDKLLVSVIRISLAGVLSRQLLVDYRRGQQTETLDFPNNLTLFNFLLKSPDGFYVRCEIGHGMLVNCSEALWGPCVCTDGIGKRELLFI